MRRFLWYVGVTLAIAVAIDVAYSLLVALYHSTRPTPNVAYSSFFWGLLGAWLIDRRRQRRAAAEPPPPPPP